MRMLLMLLAPIAVRWTSAIVMRTAILLLMPPKTLPNGATRRRLSGPIRLSKTLQFMPAFSSLSRSIWKPVSVGKLFIILFSRALTKLRQFVRADCILRASQPARQLKRLIGRVRYLSQPRAQATRCAATGWLRLCVPIPPMRRSAILKESALRTPHCSQIQEMLLHVRSSPKRA